MYSAWWRPQNADDNNTVNDTDHDALNRDRETHIMLQSDEKTILRSLDMETIMSSKKSVKYWYLHRPKTMQFVHSHVVKIQSLVRKFVVRILIRRHGIAYMVNLAKLHDEKREQHRLAEMSEEERKTDHEEDLKHKARISERKNMRREKKLMDEEEMLAKEENALYEIQLQEKEKQEREKEKAEKEKAEKEKAEKEKAEKEEAEKEKAEMEEKAKRLNPIQMFTENLEQQREKEGLGNDRLQNEEKQMEALEESMVNKFKCMQEEEKLAREKQAQEEEERQAELEAAYENSFGPSVPVLTKEGRGIIRGYHYRTKQYEIALENAGNGRMPAIFLYNEIDIELDDSQILAPRTTVETPFGIGQVIGFDPHIACYAIDNEIGANVSYVQMKDVKVYHEAPNHAIVQKISMPMEIPDEIKLKDARIVDYRIFSSKGKKFIQYKLEIQTTNYVTLWCWKRYSTFRHLCDKLSKEKKFKKNEIPVLPSRHILGNFSTSTIEDRAEKLNTFLQAAVRADHLQWGIQVDDSISVYKRRVKARAHP